MNPTTGHLVDLDKLPGFAGNPEYSPVPEHLRDEAIAKLNGQSEALVRMRGDGGLSAYRRAEKRRIARAKRKAQKLARRRNR